jgi:ssDNA-binding Zn-finger/Zn-ribbon topoisomerase 1
MPIFIPVGVHHTAKAKATVPRFVTCEKCGHGYGYWLTRTGFGYAYSHWGVIPFGRPDRIVGDAEVELEKKLKTACEAVPCPECGWYQKHMLARARQERFGWLLWAGIGGGLLGAFLLMSLCGVAEVVVGPRAHALGALSLLRMFLFLALPLLVALASVGAYFLRDYLSARYNPNDADVEERKERGWQRSMSPKQYARVMTRKAKGTNPKLRMEDLD